MFNPAPFINKIVVDKQGSRLTPRKGQRPTAFRTNKCGVVRTETLRINGVYSSAVWNLKSIRVRTWFSAAFAVLIGAWVGIASQKFGVLFREFGMYLPVSQEFMIKYGAFGYPILGSTVAVFIVMGEALSINRHIRDAALIFLILAAVWGFVTLTSPFFGPISDRSIPT